MQIQIAKTAGFCMGVRRAVEMVLDTSNTCKPPIHTCGPLIHNPQVLDLLAQKGITPLDKIPDHGKGTVLVRAHGIPPQMREKLETAGFNVVDATCPRVIKVQTIIGKHARKGHAVIIVGDEDHPEVVGLLGYAGELGVVVPSLEALKALPAFEKAIVVAQTTQNTGCFQAITRWVATHHPHYRIFNTICDSTERRQAEVSQLAAEVEAVIVVGGKNSGNTQRLTEIARQAGKPAFHIESEDDIDPVALSDIRTVGITAGASTPNWTIKRVYRALEAVRFHRQSSVRRFCHTLERALILTNLYVALGAAGLCYACIRLQNLAYSFSHIWIAMSYVLSMHILNNLTRRREDDYNEPDRATFYQKHKNLLILMALAAGGSGLMTALALGLVPFAILLIMSLMGLSYNLTLVPARLTRLKYRRIRDLPGAKTLLITVAWGLVTALLPVLFLAGRISWQALLVFLWSAGMVFCRTAFFDILDMQGDRIVGRKTLPILLGEARMLRIIQMILPALAGLLVISGVLGVTTATGYLLCLCPLGMLAVVRLHQKRRLLPGFKLEFLVETHFVMAGVLALIPVAGLG